VEGRDLESCASPPDPPMSSTNPTRLGRYEVLEEIGKGAMGVVYLARDPLIGRMVALKTFRVGFAAKDDELQQFRSRFVREAQSAGILSHPNIVTIHDVVDEGANGVCFIAMEYVKGTNLKQLLQRPDPFSHGFVIDVVSQIAEALDYAHSRGVVHRDIKPANILITSDGKVKITDFGIARLDTSNLTMEGQLLGTPNYMAPEQIQGKDVDHRADIFSLGVLFYEMLTRKKPFQGENLTQVTHKIVYEPFAPPEETVQDLPGGLSAVLTRCLEKDPNRRYPRAAEVARELRAAADQGGDLDDTVGTQEVEPIEGAEPELIPTRRLDRAEIEAASAAAAEVEDPNLAPTRRLDRDVIAAAASAAAPAQAAPKPSPEALAGAKTTILGREKEAAPSTKKPSAREEPTKKMPAEKQAPAPAVPPVPATPPPPAATAARPAPVAPASAAAPSKAAGGGRKKLWIALGGVAAAVVLVALVAVWAMSGSAEPPTVSPPVAPAPSTAPQNRSTAATALARARRAFAQGDLSAALQHVAQAELADPDSLEVKLLREAIDNRSRELASEAERVQQVAEGLQSAREAYDRRDWEGAVAAARGVLALEPTEEEARRILTDAQRIIKKDRERAEAARRAAESKPEPTPVPARAEPAPVVPAVPQAQDAAMRIDFASDRSEGVLTIYAGERQILREPFKFVKKSGFFSREKVSGTLEAQRRVPIGPLTLRVYVSMPSLPTKAVVVEQEIAGGKSYMLEIRVDAQGRTTAVLK